jgi:hypothetical protein
MSEEESRIEKARFLDEYLTALRDNPDDPGKAEAILKNVDEVTAVKIKKLAQTAQAVREIPQAEPSSTAKAAGRQRLLSGVARKKREQATKSESATPVSTRETTP